MDGSPEKGWWRQWRKIVLGLDTRSMPAVSSGMWWGEASQWFLGAYTVLSQAPLGLLRREEEGREREAQARMRRGWRRLGAA